MSTKSLSDRRQALEDCFFKEQEAKNLSRLRDELASKKKAEELGEASGIDNAQVLARLVKLDVGAGDLHALALVPLVTVAWADGSVSEPEREAILRAAHDQGVLSGTHGYQLLEAWLGNKPGADLFQSWAGYVSSLTALLDEDEVTALQENILGRANDVASAAGGILRIGAVSAAEQKALQAIADAFGN